MNLSKPPEAPAPLALTAFLDSFSESTLYLRYQVKEIRPFRADFKTQNQTPLERHHPISQKPSEASRGLLTA